MGAQYQVKKDYDFVLLPDGKDYRSLATVVLSDANVARLNPSQSAALTLTNPSVSDPVPPVIDTGIGLPSGGSTGQALTKRTGADGDVQWSTALPSLVGVSDGYVLSITAGIAAWLPSGGGGGGGTGSYSLGNASRGAYSAGATYIAGDLVVDGTGTQLWESQVTQTGVAPANVMAVVMHGGSLSGSTDIAQQKTFQKFIASAALLLDHVKVKTTGAGTFGVMASAPTTGTPTLIATAAIPAGGGIHEVVLSAPYAMASGDSIWLVWLGTGATDYMESNAGAANIGALARSGHPFTWSGSAWVDAGDSTITAQVEVTKPAWEQVVLPQPTGVPAGGTTGQALTKNSNTDGDAGWASLTKTTVGLANVDNVSDANKPVSTAQAAALALKAPLASPAFTGTPTGITAAHVGLGNVDNTADTAKPVSTAQQTALNLKANLSAISAAGLSGAYTDLTGKPSIPAAFSDLTGTVPTSALPSLAIIDVNTVANQSAMLALTAQKGDIAVRTDTGQTFILSTNSPTTLADWKEIPAIGKVTSVNGQQGIIVLGASDVGLANVDNTSDANKPVSTAQAAAIALKANIASPTFTGTVAGITAAMVGLGNVTNTSDANKPVSTAQQAALDLKANLASPTFTGTVAGISASMVGLGNVTNTSDANKPVSTAQQAALDLKANLSDHAPLILLTAAAAVPGGTAAGTIIIRTP